MVNCPHAASGCGYPQGECSGACLADKPKHQPAAPQYLTVVYRITEPGQPRALLEHADWTASSHTHAIRERDRLHAELNDVQDQRREAFRAIERLNDELGQAREQRDGLLSALRMARNNIQADRDVLLECCARPDGSLAPEDAELLAVVDGKLAQIDAAIAKAGGAA